MVSLLYHPPEYSKVYVFLIDIFWKPNIGIKTSTKAPSHTLTLKFDQFHFFLSHCSLPFTYHQNK